jgi:hypothetical protein
LDGLQAVDAADEGALAGPAGAAYHHDLAGFDEQVNFIQDVDRAKPFVDTLELDHGKFPSANN